MAKGPGGVTTATSQTYVLNGYSFLNDATVSGNPNGGNLNGGTTTVSGGDMIFEPNDIVVVTATKVDATGSITKTSSITKIVVYDSYADYLNGVVKYSYEGVNGQTATMNGSTAAIGDTYISFNANTLVSSDPNAPDLGQLFVAAGQNLSSVENGGSLTLSRFTNVDYNQSGSINPGTGEVGDGKFGGGLGFHNDSFLVICVARGTLIETAEGPRFVETLQEGDLVMTLDDGLQPIRWIGSRKVPADGAHAPIRFKAGVLGNYRDLYVSPNHRMLIKGARAELLFGATEVLVAAKHLIDDRKVTRVPRAEIEYFHFLFDCHQIVYAEGCPTESLYPGATALAAVDDEARAEIIALFPELEYLDHVGELARQELRAHEVRLLRA